MASYSNDHYNEPPRAMSATTEWREVATFPLAFNVTLYQLHGKFQPRDRYAVVYGKEVKDDLSYSDAVTKLGSALMHAAACDGKLTRA